MVTEGLPVLLAVLVTIVAYSITMKRMRRLPAEILDELNFSLSKLLWYPIALALTFGPCIGYALITKYFNLHKILFLNEFHLLITHSIGLTNALIYGIQRKREKQTVVPDDPEYSLQPVYDAEEKYNADNSFEVDKQLRKTLQWTRPY